MSGENSIKELQAVNIHAWIQSNFIKTETGNALDFDDHNYLDEIYSDNSKYLCCLKAGQIGFSTMAILKTIWLSKNKKLNIGYILPTREMVEKFVGSKVNSIAQQNPIIGEWMKDKDSIYLKQIGENFIHYLGAQTERSAIMLSLDMLVGDEYDKAPQHILETYDSRLQHSIYGYKWVFSNPTIPDFGVDRYFQMSDQKKWHIKHSCGKTFIMDEQCIDYKRQEYVCPLCRGEITNTERKYGEWVATAKGEWSGYWIPLWINPMISAKQICGYKRSKTPEYFANFVAGLPYVGTNNALSQSKLEANLVPTVNDQEGRIIIGVDTGHNIHYTLHNKQGLFYHGYISSIAENPTPNYDPYDELDKLLTRFPKSVMVSDQGGDLIGIRKLQAKYRGRVYLCWFVKETRNQQIIRWGEGDEHGKVLVDRNRAVQLVVDEISERRFPINGETEDWQPYFNHWLNIFRVREIVDENEPSYGWRWVWKRKGADHWAMASIYGAVGMDKFMESSAIVIGEDPLAGLPVGRVFDNTQNIWN